MDLSRLRTFAAVMRRGSFAAVARDLDVDPSSISRDVKALETELGVRLLQRTTKRLAPTEAGALYFERIEPLLDELERAALQASDVSDQPRGTLRIASPVSFALLNIVPLLPQFSERYPDLSLDLVLTDAKLDLLEERIDVALRLSAEREKDVVAEPLAPMVARVCASPDYIKRFGRPEKPSDLAQHACLALKLEGFGTRWKFRDPDGFETEVPITPRLLTSNAVALKQCALAGMGIILQARWIVGRELHDQRLIDLFPKFEVTAAINESPFVWLMYPSRTYLPLKVRVLLEFLREHFRNGPPWDQSSRI
jgi:DNA-binding transcriptional LysR family regulator